MLCSTSLLREKGSQSSILPKATQISTVPGGREPVSVWSHTTPSLPWAPLDHWSHSLSNPVAGAAQVKENTCNPRRKSPKRGQELRTTLSGSETRSLRLLHHTSLPLLSGSSSPPHMRSCRRQALHQARAELLKQQVVNAHNVRRRY